MTVNNSVYTRLRFVYGRAARIIASFVDVRASLITAAIDRTISALSEARQRIAIEFYIYICMYTREALNGNNRSAKTSDCHLFSDINARGIFVIRM